MRDRPFLRAALQQEADRIARDARRQTPRPGRGRRPDLLIVDDPYIEPLRVPSERADQPKEIEA